MTTFDNRENAFENQFAHDAEMQFKVVARRNKLLGLWAAGLLGMTPEAAETYAKSVISADFEHAGDDDVIRKLVTDLAATGTSEADIRTALTAKAADARHQIMEAM